MLYAGEAICCDLKNGKSPSGTISFCEYLLGNPTTARFVGKPTHFFSHAWAEGVYEFIRNALEAWPTELRGDDCGAYICFLANPQNLDISKLVGSGVEASPFYRVLAAQPPPRVIMVRATSEMITGRTPTHLTT